MPDIDLEEIGPNTIELEDISIHCMDCAQDFIWTAGEQLFYQNKNLLNPPKRCKECKKAKNQRLEAVQDARAKGKRHHYEIRSECAKCGKVTTVPFYPSQGRPVYCRTCFQEMNASPTNGTEG